MMTRSRPAPASRAKRARSASKNGFDTPFAKYQNTSPEVGCTKAVTWSHSKRWWPGARGRSPSGARTRRRIGFSPDAVLVGGEDLDDLARMLLGLLCEDGGELFLNASCSSAAARAGCPGRGAWTDQPTARSASQPRWTSVVHRSSVWT